MKNDLKIALVRTCSSPDLFYRRFFRSTLSVAGNAAKHATTIPRNHGCASFSDDHHNSASFYSSVLLKKVPLIFTDKLFYREGNALSKEGENRAK
jgi:hypothetical protein